jgi:hypothetical protein
MTACPFFQAPFHGAVGIGPVVAVDLGMYDLALHAVLGHDGVELRLDDLGRPWVVVSYQLGVYGRSHQEVLAEVLLNVGCCAQADVMIISDAAAVRMIRCFIMRCLVLASWPHCVLCFV